MEIAREDIKPIELDYSALTYKPISELRQVSILKYVQAAFELDEEIARLQNAEKDYEKLDQGVRETAEMRARNGKANKGALNDQLQQAMNLFALIDEKKHECKRQSLIAAGHLRIVKKFDAVLAKLDEQTGSLKKL